MLVKTPEIRWHFGATGRNEAILSADFVCNRSKVQILATGGADKEVKLWKCSTEFNASDDTAPVEFIHSFAAHDRSVNAVRFSPNGLHLASASDDASIIVWSCSGVEWEAIESDSQVKRSYLTCGHKGDVIDIAWSPDSNYLCSTSVDNRVVIWHVASTEIVHSINDHSQFVQGAAWDPINEFLATQGNDRTCRIYKLMNFNSPSTKAMVTPKKQKKGESDEKKIRILYCLRERTIVDDNAMEISTMEPCPEPQKKLRHRLFVDDSFNSFFRRPCWTPDGRFLFTPSGLFKAGPDDPLHTVTYGFARGDLSKPALALWSNQDAGPSVAIRCNPLFYKLRPSVSNVSTLPYRFIFAVITLDRVLIYDTQQTMPLAVVSGLHYAALTDCCWSADGRLLMVTSTDGYCSFFVLDDATLGETMPHSELPEDLKNELAITQPCAEKEEAAAPVVDQPVVFTPMIRKKKKT